MNRTENVTCPAEVARYLSTTQVGEAMGVSVTTVKRWVDDGILPAHRTQGGHRKLLLADVLRLVRSGHLPQADLARLGPGLVPAGPFRGADLLARLLPALKTGDGPTVRGVIHSAHQAGLTVEALTDQVIAPAMTAIGHDWATGRIDVLHEHRATQLLAAAIYELKAQLEANADRHRPVAIGGSPEHDHYFLANLLIQTALIDAGWDAINLGPHMPMESFTSALQLLQPRLIWISVSHLVDAPLFLAQYGQFYSQAEKVGVPVAVGGRALTDDLRARMPYTSHGDGLTHLIAFARSVHPRPRPPRRGRPPGRSQPAEE